MQLLPDQVYAQLGDLVFGAVDGQGVDWSLEKLEGWGGTAPTGAVTQKPRQSGGVWGDSYAKGRTVGLSGKVYAPSAQLLQDAFDRLNTACSVTDVVLAVTEAGLTRSVVVRRSDVVLVDWLMPTVGTWSVQVASADWRKFGATAAVSTALPSTTGGLVINNTGDSTPTPPPPTAVAVQVNFGGTGVTSVTVSTNGGGSQTASNAYPSDSTYPSDSEYPSAQ